MAELGLIAAVIQVADVGIRVSVKLYTFGQTVASADESLVFISKDISHTCSILKTLGHSLEKDREEHLYPHDAIGTADTIVKECLEIFQEMDGALLKKITRMGLDGSSSRAAIVALERLRWPFLKPRMMLLWSHLDKLKSSLHLMLIVFIYARQLVERTENPSIVNDQRTMIEHLLRTTAEQSRKYESLKAAMDGSKTLDMSENSIEGYAPATPSLAAAMIPIEAPNEGKTEEVFKASEVDPATAPVENYCLLIERLITEVEAEGYSIGHDMRRRIRDDVIHAHKRETRLLRAIYGHTELERKMRESTWKLAEMAEEVEEGERLTLAPRVRGSSGAKLDSFGQSDPQRLEPNTSHLSQDSRAPKHQMGFEWPLEDDHMAITDPARSSTFNPSISIFLNDREDPWNTYKEPRAARGKGWLPSWIPGASRLGLHNIHPLNSLKSYAQNEHMPDIPFLRSGTSMLVTEESHIVESIASSEDLAALTISTDTESFVSAQSVIGESALESHPPILVKGEEQGPLVILGDHDERIEPAAKDRRRLGMPNINPSLGELMAAWINTT